MSDAHEPAAAAALGGYRGEVAVRRFAVALGLGLLLPGLGHVYTGRPGRGLGIFLAAALGGLTFAAVAWTTDLFLPRAALIAGAGWLYLQAALGAGLWRWIRRHGGDYVLRPSNHPLVYLGLILGLEVVPAWVLLEVASEHVVLSFTVADRNAFPELLPGDVVYGSRRAFEEHPPTRGELVVVEGVGPAPTVLRVAAVPGDEVALEGGTVIVGGIPRYRDPLGAIEVFGREPAPAQVEPLRAWREFADRRSYEVYLPIELEPQDLAPLRLEAGQYFLLADLRDVEGVIDSRALGPIAAAHVVGRPLWVYWSVSPGDGRVRWSRVGLRVE
jgi:signal peptidase I